MRTFREKTSGAFVFRISPLSARGSSLISLSLGFLMISSSAGAVALNACDLNADGVVNSADVNLAVEMTLGTATCTANVVGPAVCNVVMVQRVVNASLPGGTCKAHTVALSWIASISDNVAGYNVYRRSSPDGTFVRINSSVVAELKFTDTAIQNGLTYYYVVTALDTSGAESEFSDQAVAAIPAN